jgi:hypothetical protein
MDKNPFDSTSLNDLGIGQYSGVGIDDIQDILQASIRKPARRCIVCGGTPHYKILAKVKSLDTTQLEREGYICKNCLPRNPFDSTSYGIRDLR